MDRWWQLADDHNIAWLVGVVRHVVRPTAVALQPNRTWRSRTGISATIALAPMPAEIATRGRRAASIWALLAVSRLRSHMHRWTGSPLPIHLA